MPIDTEFVNAVVSAMTKLGWNAAIESDNATSNPLPIIFSHENEEISVLIYARPLTFQSSERSDHNRPSGELHAQMIFDGDTRGRGVRNQLRTIAGYLTVLFGFHRFDDGEYVVVAYSPEYHREYAYSKSLQAKLHIVEKARNVGISQYERTNKEIVVAFHLSELQEYLRNGNIWHIRENYTETDDEIPSEVRNIFNPEEQRILPVLEETERKQNVVKVARYVRNRNFTRAIREIYERCAICGFQYNEVLDAAHIIPVAEGGNDTYGNGLGLCPNCHRMYDKGLILVDENYNIYIHPLHAEELQFAGKADSLDRLRAQIRSQLWLPKKEELRPNPAYLRETFRQRRPESTS